MGWQVTEQRALQGHSLCGSGTVRDTHTAPVAVRDTHSPWLCTGHSLLHFLSAPPALGLYSAVGAAFLRSSAKGNCKFACGAVLSCLTLGTGTAQPGHCHLLHRPWPRAHRFVLLLLFIIQQRINKSRAEAKWRNFCCFCKHVQAEMCQPPCAVGNVQQAIAAHYRSEMRSIQLSLVDNHGDFRLFLSIFSLHLFSQVLISSRFVCNNSVLQISIVPVL